MALTGRGQTVLIGFAEALAGIESAWSLLDAGFHVAAFTRRGARPPLRRSRLVRTLEVTPPEEDAARTSGDIRAAIAETRAAAVLPLDDAAVLLCSPLAEAGGPTVLAGPSGAQARLALDKREQLSAAAAAGLDVPETDAYETPGEARFHTRFPAVLKPAMAARERNGRLVTTGMAVCADQGELDAALPSLDGPLIVQPLLHGSGEALFGLAGESGVEAWSAHRRVRMMNPQGSGSSACVAKSVDEQLADAVARMLSDAGWRGLFMAEFLRDTKGRRWFIELNGRPWGSMALARRTGFEYPAWAVTRALEPSFRPSPPQESGPVVARHAGRELVHLLTVLRGPRSRALTHWPSPTRTVREVLTLRRGHRLYNWRRGDLPLFLDDSAQTVRSAFRARRRR